MMKKLFVISLLFVYLTPSIQDGFNFYKALNRTPISSIERFNRDGFQRVFKVPLPLSKRLFYDEKLSGKGNNPELRNEEFLSIFLNWFPRSLPGDAEPKEHKPKRCLDIRDVLASLNE